MHHSVSYQQEGPPDETCIIERSSTGLSQIRQLACMQSRLYFVAR